MDAEPPPSEARAFIDEVRRARVASGKKFTGPTALPDGERLAIHATVTSGAVTAPDSSITPEIEERLLERFEEMARRTKYPVPNALRRGILSLLVTELWVNARALDAPPEQMVSVTVLHGAVGPELPREFPEFKDTPGILRYMAISRTSDPKAALRRVRKAIAQLAADTEFAEFAETPWLFRKAALVNPLDPGKALRKAQRAVDALATDDEFAEFRDTPGIFRHVAMSNPANPREALRRAQKAMRSLAADEEFAEFRDSPGIFRTVAVGHPADVSEAMRKVQRTASALAADSEFAQFADSPWVYRYVAVDSADPWEALRKVKMTAAALAADEEFARYRARPGVLLQAAVGHPGNPREWLRQYQARHAGDGDASHTERLDAQRATRSTVKKEK